MLFLAPLLVVLLKEVAVNSGSAAAKHTETITSKSKPAICCKETTLFPSQLKSASLKA